MATHRTGDGLGRAGLREAQLEVQAAGVVGGGGDRGGGGRSAFRGRHRGLGRCSLKNASVEQLHVGIEK